MNKKIEILRELEQAPFIYRSFMSSEEKKLCNQLVKEGLIYKSTPPDKNATLAFYINNEGKKWLEENS